MSQPIFELETALQSLLTEQRRMLTLIDAHQAALRSMALDALAPAAAAIETSRTRLVMLETRRRAALLALCKLLKLAAPPTLVALCDHFPQRRPFLMKLRAELRDVGQQMANKTAVSTRVAGALLGHLNTVVRVIAGAVEQAGTYTRSGSPRVSARIGAIEAVG